MADGSPAYPMFDLTPLTTNPGVEMGFVQPVDGVMTASSLADYDALILLAPKFRTTSVAPGGRLGVVARFGVGYDSVDVDACTFGDVALCITPCPFICKNATPAWVIKKDHFRSRKKQPKNV